jgi:hypothetical protein
LSKLCKKMTRREAIAIAQAARKIPEGLVSDRGQLQFTPDRQLLFRKQSSIERGATYSLGAAIEANGYLLLYEILDRLGVRIISTILGDTITIVCRHKTYEGKNQAELVLEILRDRIDNFNYLTAGGFDDEAT